MCRRRGCLPQGEHEHEYYNGLNAYVSANVLIELLKRGPRACSCARTVGFGVAHRMVRSTRGEGTIYMYIPKVAHTVEVRKNNRSA